MRAHERRSRPHLSRHGRIRDVRESRGSHEGSECEDDVRRDDGMHIVVRIVRRGRLRHGGNTRAVRPGLEVHRRGQGTTDIGTPSGDDARIRLVGHRSVMSDDRRGMHAARRGDIHGQGRTGQCHRFRALGEVDHRCNIRIVDALRRCRRRGVAFRIGRALIGGDDHRLPLHGRTQIEGGIDDEMVRIERVRGIPDYEKGIGARRNRGCRPIEEEKMNQGVRCSVGGRNG